MLHARSGLSVVVFALVLGAAASPLAAQAQNAPLVRINSAAQQLAPAYWTAQRFKAARPLPLPLAAPDTRRELASAASAATAAAGRTVASDGQPPTEPSGYAGQQLFLPAAAPAAGAGGAATLPLTVPVTRSAVGSFNAYYTSTRRVSAVRWRRGAVLG